MIDFANPDYKPVWSARVARIFEIQTDLSLLVGLKEYYKEHPADFINDWCITCDPRRAEIGEDVMMPFILFERQREFINWLYERWKKREDGLCEKSRDMGVSWLCCAFAVWMLLFHPGSIVGVGSRKEEYVDKIGDPKSLFWKIRQLITMLPTELKPKGWDARKHTPYMRVLNPENEAAIIGEAGDNIGRGARSSLYFCDEAAYFEHPQAIDAALSQTSNCKIYVSTPNGAGNPFYQKRHSGRIPVFIFRWQDDPRKNEAWYQRQVEIHDPVIVAQEIDRNYEASVTDAFIPASLVNAAMSNGPADVVGVGHVQYSLDVARFGNDKTVLTCRQGRVVYWQRTWAKVDTEDTVGRVVSEIKAFKKPDQIAIDVIGVGAGVVDKLMRLYPKVAVGVNSANRVDDGMNYNLRAKMWDDMREWLKNAPVSLPNDVHLKADLTALRYFFKGGLRLMEAKEDAKKRGIKSPDYADSLALSFAEPVKIQKSDAPIVKPFRPSVPGFGY